jgi:hypothetical protein
MRKVEATGTNERQIRELARAIDLDDVNLEGPMQRSRHSRILQKRAVKRLNGIQVGEFMKSPRRTP